MIQPQFLRMEGLSCCHLPVVAQNVQTKAPRINVRVEPEVCKGMDGGIGENCLPFHMQKSSAGSIPVKDKSLVYFKHMTFVEEWRWLVVHITGRELMRHVEERVNKVAAA